MVFMLLAQFPIEYFTSRTNILHQEHTANGYTVQGLHYEISYFYLNRYTYSLEYEHKFNVHSNEGNDLIDGILSGIWLSASQGHAQIDNQMSAATIDQQASNLTQANSELPIKQQLKAEILVPIFYNNGTNVEAEKYRILFEELVNQFGAVSSEDNNVINGYWIYPQDNKAYADKNKVYWIIVPDTEENRQYFVNLQNELESLFKQESILIYFTPVLNLLSE